MSLQIYFFSVKVHFPLIKMYRGVLYKQYIQENVCHTIWNILKIGILRQHNSYMKTGKHSPGFLIFWWNFYLRKMPYGAGEKCAFNNQMH